MTRVNLACCWPHPCLRQLHGKILQHNRLDLLNFVRIDVCWIPFLHWRAGWVLWWLGEAGDGRWLYPDLADDTCFMFSLLQRWFPALLLTSLYTQKAGSSYFLNLSEKASPRIPPKPQNIVHPQKSILLTSVIFKPLFHQQTVSLSRHNFCAVQWIQQITCPCILYHSFPLSYFETNCSQHLDLLKSLKKGIIAH